jgi:hypothetical protein
VQSNERALSDDPGRHFQRRILNQDPFLQPLQRWARLDAELLHKQLPCLLVRLERLRLALGPVESEDQLGTQPLQQRVLTDEHAQLAKHLVVTSERKVAVDPVHQRRQPQLVELRHLLSSVRLEQQARQSRASPQRKRLAQELRRRVKLASRCTLAGAGKQPAEARDIEVVGLDLDAVAAVCGRNRVVAVTS